MAQAYIEFFVYAVFLGRNASAGVSDGVPASAIEGQNFITKIDGFSTELTVRKEIYCCYSNTAREHLRILLYVYL